MVFPLLSADSRYFGIYALNLFPECSGPCNTYQYNIRPSSGDLKKGYRMVFTSICELMSSDQFSYASSEHFKNYNWRAASTWLRKFSARWNLSLSKRFAPSNLGDTFKTGPLNRRKAREQVKILSRFNHSQ